MVQSFETSDRHSLWPQNSTHRYNVSRTLRITFFQREVFTSARLPTCRAPRRSDHPSGRTLIRIVDWIWCRHVVISAMHPYCVGHLSISSRTLPSEAFIRIFTVHSRNLRGTSESTKSERWAETTRNEVMRSFQQTSGYNMFSLGAKCPKTSKLQNFGKRQEKSSIFLIIAIGMAEDVSLGVLGQGTREF